MNADEAKREAVRILANRLKAWDVDEALKKAQMFMDDLRLAGWRWDAPINRPIPPKPHEACRTCGRHVAQCVCDAPQLQPTRPPAEVATQGAAACRDALHHDERNEA